MPSIRPSASILIAVDPQARDLGATNDLLLEREEPTLPLPRHRVPIAHARDAVALVDPDGHILDASRRCEELLGLPPGGLVGHKTTEYTAPGHEDAEIEGPLARDGAAPRGTPLPIRAADGSVVFIEWSTTTLDLDGRPLVLMIGRDVTENVRAREALRQSEERYRALLERIPDMVVSALEGAGRFSL